MPDPTSAKERSPAPEGASPLAEADPASVDILVDERLRAIFNGDPLLLSEDQLARGVAYYRQLRQNYEKDEAAKTASGTPRRRRAAPKSVAEALNIPDSIDI